MLGMQGRKEEEAGYRTTVLYYHYYSVALRTVASPLYPSAFSCLPGGPFYASVSHFRRREREREEIGDLE